MVRAEKKWINRGPVKPERNGLENDVVSHDESVRVCALGRSAFETLEALTTGDNLAPLDGGLLHRFDDVVGRLLGNFNE